MEKIINDKDTIKAIFFNIIKAIILILYFFAINIALKYIDEKVIYEYIKIFAIVYLLLGIIYLEKAYKNDSVPNVIFAIELFVISAHTLSIEYVINKFKFELAIYLLCSSYIFAIYYVLKSIIIYTKAKANYMKSFSDVPEIVKNEKPIVKEAKRKEEKEDIKDSKKDVEEVDEQNGTLENKMEIEKDNKKEVKSKTKKVAEENKKEADTKNKKASIKKEEKEADTKNKKASTKKGEKETDTKNKKASTKKEKKETTSKTSKSIKKDEKITSKKTKSKNEEKNEVKDTKKADKSEKSSENTKSTKK